MPLNVAREINSKTYYNRIPCVNGHIGLRYTNSQSCVQCAKERYYKSKEDKKKKGIDRDSIVKARRDIKKLSKQQLSLMIGLAIGDGSIRVQSDSDTKAGRRKASQLYIAHSYKQKLYAQWKLELLNKALGGNAKLCYGKTTAPSTKKLGVKYKTVYFAKSHPAYLEIHSMLYKKGIKHINRKLLSYLDIQSIAIWFMDDGTCNFNLTKNGLTTSIYASIATQIKDKEEVLEIIDYFNKTWGVKFSFSMHSRTKRYDIRCNNVEHSKKFMKMIEPYIAPGMEYKWLPYFRLTKGLHVPCDKECANCGDKVAGYYLPKDRLCQNCYNYKRSQRLKNKVRYCILCNEVKEATWFVGNRCRACYQRIKRRGKVSGG